MLSKTKKRSKQEDLTWKVLSGNQQPVKSESQHTGTNAYEPCARNSHSALACGSVMLVFGGMTQDGEILSDFCSFDFHSQKWTLLSGLEESKQDNNSNTRKKKGNERIGRINHSAVVFSSDGIYRMIVFGGKNNFFLNDMWHIDSENLIWERMEYCTNGNPEKPSLRYGHSAVYYRSEFHLMYIFGGYDALGLACNDLFEYNIDSKTWKKINWKENTEGTEELVPSRYFHSAVTYSSAIWIFGGKGDKGALSHLIKFDLDLMKWVPIEITGAAPTPRWNHAVSVDREQGIMYIHGGMSDQGVQSDIWAFHFGTHKWNLLKAKQEFSLSGHTACCYAGDIYIFGGKSDKIVSNQVVQGIFPKESGWPTIPTEIGLLIFQDLAIKDICSVERTCRRWKQISSLEIIWKPLFMDAVRDPHYDFFYNLLRKDSAFENLTDRLKLLEIVRYKHNQTFRMLPKFKNVPKPNLKIVIVGSGAVGKTCMCTLQTQGTINWDYMMSYWDSQEVTTTIFGFPCSFIYWDTAGQEDYDRLRPLSYPATDVFIVMFSLLSQDSFNEAMDKFIPEINHHCPKDTPFVVVGNKTDLLSDQYELQQLASNGKSIVDEEVARKIALEKGAVEYLRTSIRTEQGTKELHELVLRIGLYGVTPQKSTKSTKNSRCKIQ